ncbi:SWIM zinc finger [Azospirillaceae bacterium]
MAAWNSGWAPYVRVAERRRKAEREVEKMRKKGVVASPVVIAGRGIASTFWGKAWCNNLESYRDYENRLPRGRTYVRNGSVIDLQIAPLSVKALVSGSEIYKVSVSIAAASEVQWRSICRDCAGGVDSLVELLQGKLSKAVMERLCRQDEGLFPKPKEIKFSCSCPDSASMCKHIAAVLYGVGARLDQQPELLFRLRAVNEADLVAGLDQALPLSKAEPAPDKILDSDDLSALFGFELAEGNGLPAVAEPVVVTEKVASSVKSSRAGSASVAKKTEVKIKSVEPKETKSRSIGVKAAKLEKQRIEQQKSKPKGNAVWDISDIYKNE